MEKLKESLKGFSTSFQNVVLTIAQATNKNKEFINKWLWNKDKKYFEIIQKKLKKLNIELDGKHATLTAKGLTFDYIVYKNRLLQNYPKSVIDLDLVFEGDEFSIMKENGKVVYNHIIANPFVKKLENLKGGYCIIRIEGRGEFQTTMGLEELQKHKNLSNMQYLYNDWWQELYKKTILRKNLKFHFEDEFQDIQEIDDEGMDNDLRKKENVLPALKMEDTENFNKVLKALENGFTFEQIETKWQLSKEIKELLTKKITK